MTSVDKAAIGWSITIVAIAIGFTLAGQSEPTESVSSGFGVMITPDEESPRVEFPINVYSQSQSEPTESVSSGFGVMITPDESKVAALQSGPLVCPLGQFAAPGDLVCTYAPAGTFVDTVGATSSTLCPAGTFQSLTGQISCILAPAGTFVDTTGATEATLCPAGTWSSEPGATSCMDCPNCNNVGS